MTVDGITSMLGTNAANEMAAGRADSVKNNINKVSSDTTSDELMEVCKDFVSYFVEEILKEIKENLTNDEEDEDGSTAMLTDFHMESAIETISDAMMDQSGLNFTQQLYEQMKRNYNIE